MLKKFSRIEMLLYWKRRYGLMALHEAAPTEETLTPMDAKLLDDIELWYADLLRRASAELLPITDCAADVKVNYLVPRGATILLPADCLRVVSVKMSTWSAPLFQFAAPGSQAEHRQSHPFTRACGHCPVAVKYPDSLGVFGMDEGSELDVEELKIIVRSSEQFFTLDPSLLRSEELLIH